MQLITHKPSDLFFIEGNRTVSFEDVYERHWKMLCSIGEKLTGDREIAQDIVQEVFVSFLEKYKGKEIRNVSAFLIQSLKFQCFTWLRDAKIEDRHIADMIAVREENTTENHVIASNLVEHIDSIVADMPVRVQETFRLSRYENLSNDEIASRLEINKKTVENHLTRALQILRLTLKVISLIVIQFQF